MSIFNRTSFFSLGGFRIFFKSMSIYTFTSILNSGVQFLLLPVLSSYLSTEDYGTLSLLSVSISFAIPLVIAGVDSAIGTEFFRMDKEELPRYISSALIIPACSMLILSLLFFIFRDFLANFLNLPFWWMIAIPLFAFLQGCSNIILIIFQVRKEPHNYATYQIALTLTNITLTLFFVIACKMQWQGRAYGIYLSYFIFLLIAAAVIRKMKYFTLSIRKKHITEALRFGIPLIPHVIGGMILNLSDRLFISKMTGERTLGFYAMAYNIAILVSIVMSSFNNAWVPHLFGQLKEITPEKKKKIVKQIYLFSAFALVFAFAVNLCAPLFFTFSFINIKFIDCLPFVLWIALGYSFFGMYFTVTNFIFYEKKTYVLAYLTFGNAILNLILNYFFILHFGAIGAAYATALSNLIFFLLTWYLSNKIYPMPWFSFYK